MKELDFLAGNFFTYEIPKEKRYLLKYFSSDIGLAFVRYYLCMGESNYFCDHTGYYCHPSWPWIMQKRVEQLLAVHAKATEEMDLDLLTVIEDGKYKDLYGIDTWSKRATKVRGRRPDKKKKKKEKKDYEEMFMVRLHRVMPRKPGSGRRSGRKQQVEPQQVESAGDQDLPAGQELWPRHAHPDETAHAGDKDPGDETGDKDPGDHQGAGEDLWGWQKRSP